MTLDEAKASQKDAKEKARAAQDSADKAVEMALAHKAEADKVGKPLGNEAKSLSALGGGLL